MPADIDKAILLTNEALKGKILSKGEIAEIIKVLVDYLAEDVCGTGS